MPAGFKAMNSLPRSLPRQTSFILLVSMDTSAAGPRSGTITIASDDADESLYRIPVSVASVNQTISSDFGTVETWQTIYVVLQHGIEDCVDQQCIWNNLRSMLTSCLQMVRPIPSGVLIGNPNSVSVIRVRLKWPR